MGCKNCNPTSIPSQKGLQGPQGPQGEQGEQGDPGICPPCPEELFIGKTLYVSKLGDDATAVPYDIANHYLTITAAKNDALPGDTVVVFPGDYPEHSLFKNGVRYHFMNGARILLSDFNPAFDVTGFIVNDFRVTGDLEIVLSGNANCALTIIGLTPGTSAFFECKSLINNTSNLGKLISIANNQPNGSITIIVKEDIIARLLGIEILYINPTSHLIINANRLIHKGTSEGFNLNSSLIRITGGDAPAGSITINANEIRSEGVGGCNPILVSGYGGSIIIRCPRLVNNFTGYPTANIFVINRVPYFKFEGNMYSNQEGSLAAGVWTSVDQYQTKLSNYWPNNFEIKGDIYVDQNYAMYINNGPARLKYSGNIYGNNSGDAGLTIGLWPDPIPNSVPSAIVVKSLIYIGRQNDFDCVTCPNTFGSEMVSYTWLKDATLNQFAEGASCIYKYQGYLAAPGGPYYNTGVLYEATQYLELDNVRMYVPISEGAYCIEGETPGVPPPDLVGYGPGIVHILDNSVQINACAANMPVSPAITEEGEPVLINSNLIGDNNTFMPY